MDPGVQAGSVHGLGGCSRSRLASADAVNRAKQSEPPHPPAFIWRCLPHNAAIIDCSSAIYLMDRMRGSRAKITRFVQQRSWRCSVPTSSRLPVSPAIWTQREELLTSAPMCSHVLACFVHRPLLCPPLISLLYGMSRCMKPPDIDST